MKLTKSELEDKAKECFKQYPNAAKIYMTSDGNCFVGGLAANYANSHAKQWELDAFEVCRGKESDISEEVAAKEVNAEGEKSLTAKEIIELIEAAETKEVVDTLAEGDERRTVIRAALKRIEELAKAKEENDSETLEKSEE